MIDTDVNILISWRRLIRRFRLAVNWWSSYDVFPPASVGHGLRLGAERWAHLLHPEPGLQHLAPRDRFPRGPAGLREAQPSVRVCGDGRGQRRRAPLRHRHGPREDGQRQRWGPRILPDCVSILCLILAKYPPVISMVFPFIFWKLWIFCLFYFVIYKKQGCNIERPLLE